MGNLTASLKANRRVVKVPKGTSKYQAAWIVDDGEEGSEKDDDDDDEDDDMDDDMMEEAVSQVPPRADIAGDFHGTTRYPRTMLSFLLALCKGRAQSQDLPGFPLLSFSCVSCCFCGLLDTEMRDSGVAWVTILAGFVVLPGHEQHACLWTLCCPVCQEGESSGEEEPAEEECETMTVSECLRDDQYDEKMEEDEQMLEKYKQERMDEMFPDEVDTPRDVPARVR